MQNLVTVGDLLEWGIIGIVIFGVLCVLCYFISTIDLSH